jgi:hypothetical protein
MLKLPTHFDQVPLETVKKMVQEQMLREPIAEPYQDTKKQPWADEDLAPQELSMTVPSRSSQREF